MRRLSVRSQKKLEDSHKLLQKMKKKKKKHRSLDPCAKCPLRGEHEMVFPTLPRHPKLLAVGYAPGAREIDDGENFKGKAGQLLRATLRAVGLDPRRDVGYVNLTRHRPPGEDWEGSPWKKARKLCEHFLLADLAGTTPLLLLGKYPAARFIAGRGVKISSHRGMWFLDQSGRPVFATWHPSYVLRKGGGLVLREFGADILKVANRVTGREKPVEVEWRLLTTIEEIEKFGAWLAKRKSPWGFDCETYDKASPERIRPKVGTNPFHKDFAVRMLGIGYAPFKGVAIELRNFVDVKDRVRAALSPAFKNETEKATHTGWFDENAIVMGGWVDEVRNRKFDCLLALVAMDDGTRAQNTLQRAMVELLRETAHWDVPKDRMGVLKSKQVAEGCVRDACGTLRLRNYLLKRLERGKRL